VVADLFQVHVPVPELMLRGTPRRRNLRRESITMDELHEKLREQGIEDLKDVKVAYLEGDGEISVIRNSGQPGKPPESRSVPGR
jgi:uncharacterized membrane protein YcaP (DUF421 family)